MAFKRKKYPIAVVGAYIFNKKGELLLVQSKKYKGSYGTPGGHIEFGESLEQAFKREVLEETGLKVSRPKLFDIKELINLKEYAKTGHYLSFRMYCRVATNKVKLDLKEASKFIWVKPEKALKMNVLSPTKDSIKKYLKLKNYGK